MKSKHSHQSPGQTQKKGHSKWDEPDLLQKQMYSLDRAEVKKHYDFLRPFFSHRNYVKINGHPVLFVYEYSKFQKFISGNCKILNEMAVQDGFPGNKLN